MAEDPQREIRREELKRNLENLRQAQSWLVKLHEDDGEEEADDDAMVA